MCGDGGVIRWAQWACQHTTGRWDSRPGSASVGSVGSQHSTGRTQRAEASRRTWWLRCPGSKTLLPFPDLLPTTTTSQYDTTRKKQMK